MLTALERLCKPEVYLRSLKAIDCRRTVQAIWTGLGNKKLWWVEQETVIDCQCPSEWRLNSEPEAYRVGPVSAQICCIYRRQVSGRHRRVGLPVK